MRSTLRLRPHLAAMIAVTVVALGGCGAEPPTPTPPPATSAAPTETITTSPAATVTSPTTAAAGLLHCATAIIKIREVITSQAPDQVATGWGFSRGDRAPCEGRRGCWLKVQVPNPDLYPPGHEHWIPVSATKSELANPGAECFNSEHYLGN